MRSDEQYKALSRLRAPGHILVDEDYVEAVMATVKLRRFGQQLPGVRTDDPDKAGLVALSWDDDDRDPAEVVDRIRQVAPHLEDMVSPDHTVGMLPSLTGDEGASIEMGGPASPAEPTDEAFSPRTDEDLAGRGVVVGVVDSGMVAHPYVDGAYLATPGSMDPLDEDSDGELDRQAGHGVFVAGLILREAPAAVVRVIRAFDKDGYVRIRRAANAIVELHEQGADVINLSFGRRTRRDRAPLAHRKALSKIGDSTVVVAAAGNHKPGDVEHAKNPLRAFWPGAFEGVVAVAALDTTAGDFVTMADFSNIGPWVDVAAPGTDVVSTYVNHRRFTGWARWSGTSFAAPTVAGRIAATMTDGSGNRVRSARKARDKVLKDAAAARPPGLSFASDVVGAVVLPRDWRASQLVTAGF